MKITVEIKDKDILEAIAEQYPKAVISLEEVKDHLESRFSDLLSFSDADLDWQLTNDQYFKTLKELAHDRQQKAEEERQIEEYDNWQFRQILAA